MAEGAPSGEYVLVETRVASFSGSPGQRTTGQAKVAEADAGCLPGGPEGNSRPGNRSGPATEPTRRGATGSPLPLGQPTHTWLRTKGRAPGGEQPPGAFLLAKLTGDEHPVANSHRVLFCSQSSRGTSTRWRTATGCFFAGHLRRHGPERRGHASSWNSRTTHETPAHPLVSCHLPDPRRGMAPSLRAGCVSATGVHARRVPRQPPIRSSSQAGTASRAIRSWACVSRWRTVTVWALSVSLSIVKQKGVPASSMRA